MKTIEAVYEKFIGRTDKFPEHFEDFTADIQAYVKQEMRKIVVGVEFCNSDISAKGLQDKILKAIENYGKERE